jgi:hypothetical protein
MNPLILLSSHLAHTIAISAMGEFVILQSIRVKNYFILHGFEFVS